MEPMTMETDPEKSSTMKPMRAAFLFFLFFLVLSSPTTLPAQDALALSEVTFGVRQWPLPLHPMQAESGRTTLIRLVFEPLVAFDDLLALDPERSLAKDIEVLGDRTHVDPADLEISSGQTAPADGVFEIGLREGLSFSDGSPVTSQDVVRVLEALHDSMSGHFPSDLEVHIKALGDRRVRILLSRPWGPYLTLLGSARAAIYRKGEGGELLGTGPYRVKEQEEGTIVLVPSETARRPGTLPAVRFVAAPVGLARQARLLTGRIHAIDQPTVRERRDLADLEGFRVEEATGSRFLYMFFNVQDPWIKYNRMRQALVRGIDTSAFDGLDTGTGHGIFRWARDLFPRDLVTDNYTEARYRWAPTQARELAKLEGVTDAGFVLRTGVLQGGEWVDLATEDLKEAATRSLLEMNIGMVYEDVAVSEGSLTAAGAVPQVVLGALEIPWRDPDFLVQALLGMGSFVPSFTGLGQGAPGLEGRRAQEGRRAREKLTSGSRQFLYGELIQHLSREYPLMLIGVSTHSWILSTLLEGASVRHDGSLDLSGVVPPGSE